MLMGNWQSLLALIGRARPTSRSHCDLLFSYYHRTWQWRVASGEYSYLFFFFFCWFFPFLSFFVFFPHHYIHPIHPLRSRPPPRFRFHIFLSISWQLAQHTPSFLLFISFLHSTQPHHNTNKQSHLQSPVPFHCDKFTLAPQQCQSTETMSDSSSACS